MTADAQFYTAGGLIVIARWLISSVIGLGSIALAPSANAQEIAHHGGAVPEGMHLETRANPYMVAAGVSIFGLGYLPWAIAGVVETATVPAASTNNYVRVHAWHAVPLLGHYVALFVFDGLQRTDCERYSATGSMATSAQLGAACVDQNSGMTDANGMTLPPRYEPRLATPGDWIWATVLTGAQVYGIVLTVWGLRANTVAVANRPIANQPVSFRVFPGVVSGGNAVGLSMEAITF